MAAERITNSSQLPEKPQIETVKKPEKEVSKTPLLQKVRRIPEAIFEHFQDLVDFQPL